MVMAPFLTRIRNGAMNGWCHCYVHGAEGRKSRSEQGFLIQTWWEIFMRLFLRIVRRPMSQFFFSKFNLKKNRSLDVLFIHIYYEYMYLSNWYDLCTSCLAEDGFQTITFFTRDMQKYSFVVTGALRCGINSH